MGKVKWASTKFFSYPTKDIKEFRNYLSFALKDLINHENVFSEYLLSDQSATMIADGVAASEEKTNEEFVPSAVLGTSSSSPTR
jgi:hypothetical protein